MSAPQNENIENLSDTMTDKTQQSAELPVKFLRTEIEQVNLLTEQLNAQ